MGGGVGVDVLRHWADLPLLHVLANGPTLVPACIRSVVSRTRETNVSRERQSQSHGPHGQASSADATRPFGFCAARVHDCGAQVATNCDENLMPDDATARALSIAIAGDDSEVVDEDGLAIRKMRRDGMTCLRRGDDAINGGER